jgi:hypothetical protein
MVAVIASAAGALEQLLAFGFIEASEETAGSSVSGQWYGTGEWPGVFLTISFSVDDDNTTVRNVRIFFNCADKRPQIERGEALAAESDGTFRINQGQLEFILAEGNLRGSGQLLADGTATGRIQSRLSLRCEGRIVRVEGVWKGRRTASRT